MKEVKNLVKASGIIGIDVKIKSKEIVEVKRYLEKFKNTYVLEPHITLLLLPVEKYSEEYILKFRTELKNIKEFKIKFKNVELDKERNFFSLKIKDDKKLFEIHKKLLEVSTSFKNNGIREKDLKQLKLEKFSEKEKEYLLKYNYHRVLDDFQIHLTLGNVSRETNINEVYIELQKMSENLICHDFIVDNINILYHSDTKLQKNLDVTHETKIKLDSSGA